MFLSEYLRIKIKEWQSKTCVPFDVCLIVYACQYITKCRYCQMRRQQFEEFPTMPCGLPSLTHMVDKFHLLLQFCVINRTQKMNTMDLYCGVSPFSFTLSLYLCSYLLPSPILSLSLSLSLSISLSLSVPLSLCLCLFKANNLVIRLSIYLHISVT